MWRFCRGLKTPAGLLLHTETKMSIRSFLAGFARSPSHKRWFIDWAACTLMLLLYRGILHHRSDGFHQQFTLNDPSIQHPHTDNQRVPEHLLTLLLLPPHYGEEMQKEMRFAMHAVFFIACMVLCVLCHLRQMSSRSAIGVVQVRAIHSRVVVGATLLAVAVLVRTKRILVPCLILRPFFYRVSQM